MASGDVSPFDRFARYYDMVMPGASRSVLQDGLDVAQRPIHRLVDVGGGTGRATVAVDVPQRVVLDAAAGMLRRASGRGLDCVQGDASRLPLQTDSVDAITIVDALHHMYDWDGVFREAARVLRPGGVLVIREFDPTTLLGRGLVLGERLVGFDSQFADPATLAQRLGRAGLLPEIVDDGFGYTVVGVVPKPDTQ
jgi:demethylmenaquinone methyltransferase/2-methoxy-6-polyprenyl-1,4-benzoquinol methylase